MSYFPLATLATLAFVLVTTTIQANEYDEHVYKPIPCPVHVVHKTKIIKVPYKVVKKIPEVKVIKVPYKVPVKVPVYIPVKEKKYEHKYEDKKYDKKHDYHDGYGGHDDDGDGYKKA